jgi:hydroxymethylbilane synthase
MIKQIRIGTRESQLALWQAGVVQKKLSENGYDSILVPIKSEGDLDLQTPLYEMGVQGIFTRSLDIALLNDKIDVAVHSMKDVPTQLPAGIVQGAVLKRGSFKDILVPKKNSVDQSILRKIQNGEPLGNGYPPMVIATSSIRRKAQWLYHYPNHKIESLRGNVNTRLSRLEENQWHGAIFAAAGLERIGLRPRIAIDLEWMLPAPAQGAIITVCREQDLQSRAACQSFNDPQTSICTHIERDFLRTLLGGCSTPISALALVRDESVHFWGNIVSPDGNEKIEIEKQVPTADAFQLGRQAAEELLEKGAGKITEALMHGKK